MARPRTSSEHKRELARNRKRRQRERERNNRRHFSVVADVAAKHIKGSFAEFMTDRGNITEESLDAVGIQVTGTWLDQELQNFTTEIDDWEDVFGAPPTSLNRATVMIGVMIDAARELAEFVNEFKLRELDERIAELGPRPAGDPEVEAFHQIKKRYRRTTQPRIPVYWIKK